MRFMVQHVLRFMERLMPASLALKIVMLSFESTAAVEPMVSAPVQETSGVRGSETPEPMVESKMVKPSDALRITVDPRIEDAEFIREWIREATVDELSKLVPRAGRAQWIAVDLTGLTYRFELQVAALRDGVSVTGRRPPMRCECTNEQLLELVGKQVAIAVEHLNASAGRPSQGGGGSTSVLPPGGGGESDVRRYRPTRLGLSGFILTGVGGASLIGGLVMLTRPLGTVDRPEYFARNWKSPGIGFTAGGAAVLVGGVVMWVTDVVLCRSRGNCGLARRRARSTSAFIPSWRHPGVGVGGRF